MKKPVMNADPNQPGRQPSRRVSMKGGRFVTPDADVTEWERKQREQEAVARDRREQAEKDRRKSAVEIAFTDHEKQIAWHCLMLGSERFDADVKEARAAGHPLLAEQFERQAVDARALMDRLSP